MGIAILGNLVILVSLAILVSLVILVSLAILVITVILARLVCLGSLGSIVRLGILSTVFSLSGLYCAVFLGLVSAEARTNIYRFCYSHQFAVLPALTFLPFCALLVLPFYHLPIFPFGRTCRLYHFTIRIALGASGFNASYRFPAPSGITVLPCAPICGPAGFDIFTISGPLLVLPLYHFTNFTSLSRLTVSQFFHPYRFSALSVLTFYHFACALPVLPFYQFYHFTILPI